MQMATFCLQLHLWSVEFYLQKIKMQSAISSCNMQQENSTNKTKAEVYDLKCDEIISMIKTAFYARKQDNNFSFLSLYFPVSSTILSFFPLFCWP